jgi:ribonuclease Z
VRAGGVTLLVDAGRGVLMRLAGAGVMANGLDAVLVTHLHSDHITDVGDVITSRWISTFESTPLPFVGPPGLTAVVDGVMASLAPDISYRVGHHADLTWEPENEVTELREGVAFEKGDVRVIAAPTDHRPVEPTVAFRIEHDGVAVVIAGDTVPCPTLDELCVGADALVHTVIRKDVIANIPIPRLQDVLDYHSSVEQAAQTAAKAGVGTLVLTHYVPGLVPGTEGEWRDLAAAHFDGRIELGDDLHRVEVG